MNKKIKQYKPKEPRWLREIKKYDKAQEVKDREYYEHNVHFGSLRDLNVINYKKLNNS